VRSSVGAKTVVQTASVRLSVCCRHPAPPGGADAIIALNDMAIEGTEMIINDTDEIAPRLTVKLRNLTDAKFTPQPTDQRRSKYI